MLDGPSKPKDNKEAWDEKKNPPVVINPESGTVAAGSKRRTQLSFCPPCKLTLKNCTLLLKVRITVVKKSFHLMRISSCIILLVIC